MPEAVFRIGIGGAGQGPSWCPDRYLLYKNYWHGIARKSRRHPPERFGSYSMPYLQWRSKEMRAPFEVSSATVCNLWLHSTIYSLSARKSGARWEKLSCNQLMAISHVAATGLESFQAKSNCRRWRISCLSSNFCMYNTYTTSIHAYSTFSWCADLQRIPRRAHQAKIHSFCANFPKNSDFYYL